MPPKPALAPLLSPAPPTHAAATAASAAAYAQTLVLGTSVAVVCFIVLLQNPMLGSPTWLPLLGAGWLAAAAFTLLVQSAVPLPDSARWTRGSAWPGAVSAPVSAPVGHWACPYVIVVPFAELPPILLPAVDARVNLQPLW
jgi:hypothetical protein